VWPYEHNKTPPEATMPEFAFVVLILT